MKKIAGKKMLGPTLQEIELVPITDPIRLAAIDRRRKAVQRAMGERSRPVLTPRPPDVDC